MTKLTQDEFIDNYMEASNLDPAFRTKEGYAFSSYVVLAIPCNCGEEPCHGWQMMIESTRKLK